MPTPIYPRFSVVSPEAEMLRPPVMPISKCWETELSLLTQLKGSLNRLPEGEATLALFLRCSPEGAAIVEVSAPGYERQPVDFHLHESGRRTHNVRPVVFRFEEQPTAVIPLIGLYVGQKLVMRGGLTRILYAPQDTDVTGAQVRLGAGDLRLRF